MIRGSIYWISLEPATPPEMGKVRPGVVVSNSVQNERLGSVVVLPLSGQAPEIWPLRIEARVKGMKTSYAVIPGIRQVSKTRLHERIGQATDSFLARIDEALAIYLSD
jgi:mRNA interferase MazF